MAAPPTGTVTFLFTDIEGSTRRWEQDAAAMRVALVAHDRTLQAAIDAHGGVVFATGGDGFAVAYARAADALACAADAQRALETAGDVRVRMGVHTGEADERDGNYFGPAVNRAARLMAIAHGGQVLVSATTERIATGFELLDLGEHELRDLMRPEHVFQLAGPGLRRDFPALRTNATPGATGPGPAAAATPAVSAREAEVLALLGDRLTNSQIAQRLFVSVRTVESHVSSLLRKLGAADRHELAALAAMPPSPSSDGGSALVGAPEQLTTFVGRGDELRAVADALATHRLVTVVGPGGMGKTRLLIEAARPAHGNRADAHTIVRALARIAYARRFASEAQQRFDEAAGLAADDRERAQDIFDAGHSAFTILRGDVGFEHFITAGELAERAGDHRTAALAFALAAERANRFTAEFPVMIAQDRLAELLRRAEAAGAQIADAHVDAQLAITRAWLSTGRPNTSTIPAAEEALTKARATGDPALESSALDALGGALWSEHRARESADLTGTRSTLIERLRIADPRAGAEIMDSLHMICDTRLAVADLPDALAAARRAVAHPLSGGAMHVMHRELVIALFLTGEFDEAVVHAEQMRGAWERAGRPAAGWMAPAAFCAALLYGLRGDADAHAQWLAMSEEVCLSRAHPMRGFAAIRLALHRGDLSAAHAALDAYERAEPRTDGLFPWSAAAIGFEPYVWSTACELAAVDDRDDAAVRLASVAATYPGQRWVQATALRGEGRVTGDRERFVAAAAAFDAIDARFEAAVTRLLIGGEDATLAERDLRALGCTLPATF